MYPAQLEAAHSPPSSHVHVLVADADADTRTLFGRLFALAGYEVVEAIDGRDALTKAFTRRPALVVTGLRLPMIDGYALCDILRHDHSTADVPILVVTGEARAAEVMRAERAGADSVLVKPLAPEAVAEEAHRLLSLARDPLHRAKHFRAETDAHQQDGRVRGAAVRPRRTLVKAFERSATTTPPSAPPTLRCPSCDRVLAYEESHIGGVSARFPEQWDYFVCPGCGGKFQFRHRTRKLRTITDRR